ncbi:lysoplasmalogenase [Chitinophaga vietnamensis]|uniref:lysoplasmalogenase n=1 Tax=Chitinophaga vietnamensis TaxID=2593957 RepID=UPI0011779B3A|nr:lysoplasmalogenase [Chitinophaga vietnamensis]
MLKSRWLTIYAFTLLADLVLVGLRMDSYRYATKPLLTIILAAYVISSAGSMPIVFRRFLLLALLFSLGGDVLLMFEAPACFLYGLGSFLLAHVMYIFFFLKIRYSGSHPPLCRYPLIFLNVIYLLAFLVFMFPMLGSLKIPVIIYAITIFVMVQSVLHAFHFRQEPEGWYCIIGAVLFMLSDTLIATGKFYHPLPANGLLVMLTYGLAQLGLVYGAVKFFTPVEK